MERSVFKDKSAKPDAIRLIKAIGDTAKSWEAIKKHIEDIYGAVNEEWKFYGASSGWTLKTLLKKRNLFFLVPLKGYFRVAFVFGDKAVGAVEKSDLPKDLIETLRNARKYAEGRGIRVEVRSLKDAESVMRLIDIKIRN
jgi:hypothetical protein